MTPATFALVLLSVALSASAQILLKIGMSSAAVQAALAGPVGLRTVLVVAFAPAVFGGLLTFGLSAVVWLLVLSRIDVSYAYPCVALGIVLTMLAGHLMLGEALTVSRIAGLALIVSGVGVVALGR